MDERQINIPGISGRERFPNSNTVRLIKNYNGSGPEAFGGAEDWPVIEAKITFDADCDPEYIQAVWRMIFFLVQGVAKSPEYNRAMLEREQP